MTETTADWDAVVLAGGRATRLEGIDKTALEFEGRSLLQHALHAVSGARTIVVVGGQDLRGRLPSGVLLASEEPRFGGPAAATQAGLRMLPPGAARVALVAADLPRASEALGHLLEIGRLAAHVDGVVAADSSGRIQHLLGVYSSASLARAIAGTGPLANASMRTLTSSLVLCRVQLADRLCADIDTPSAAHDHGIALTGEYAHA